jgi:hypothetical protein
MTQLDASTIEELSAFLTSNDGPRYLSVQKLRDFLGRAGITDIPGPEGMTRRDLARQALSSADSAELAILRLADPREFPGDTPAWEETLSELGKILRPESLTITHDDRRRPAIVPLTAQGDSQELRGIALKVSLDEVILDPALAAVAQDRLAEAERCQGAGAYMAAIIMLGSLLEGVLIAAIQERPHAELRRPIESTPLQDLINVAHKEHWIQFDAHRGSDILRQYRNLVHPRLQLAIGHHPDADTLDICRSVVNAALNDLAATTPRHPGATGPGA